MVVMVEIKGGWIGAQAVDMEDSQGPRRGFGGYSWWFRV